MSFASDTLEIWKQEQLGDYLEEVANELAVEIGRKVWVKNQLERGEEHVVLYRKGRRKVLGSTLPLWLFPVTRWVAKVRIRSHYSSRDSKRYVPCTINLTATDPMAVWLREHISTKLQNYLEKRQCEISFANKLFSS